jgi:hypothetical protein
LSASTFTDLGVWGVLVLAAIYRLRQRNAILADPTTGLGVYR